MEKQMTFLWEGSAWEFVFVTIILAGGAAFLTGRAVARAWEGETRLIFYMVLLAAATRFIHFSLFSGSFFLPSHHFVDATYYYSVDVVILIFVAMTEYKTFRRKQLRTIYGFIPWSR